MGSRKLHICTKVTKLGYVIGHKIDKIDELGRGSERPAVHTQQELTHVPRPGVAYFWLCLGFC